MLWPWQNKLLNLSVGGDVVRRGLIEVAEWVYRVPPILNAYIVILVILLCYLSEGSVPEDLFIAFGIAWVAFRAFGERRAAKLDA